MAFIEYLRAGNIGGCPQASKCISAAECLAQLKIGVLTCDTWLRAKQTPPPWLTADFHDNEPTSLSTRDDVGFVFLTGKPSGWVDL